MDKSELVGAIRDVRQKLMDAMGRARLVPKPGIGVCGMTVEAQTRASNYNGVDAWPLEEAIDALTALEAELLS